MLVTIKNGEMTINTACFVKALKKDGKFSIELATGEIVEVDKKDFMKIVNSLPSEEKVLKERQEHAMCKNQNKVLNHAIKEMSETLGAFIIALKQVQFRFNSIDGVIYIKDQRYRVDLDDDQWELLEVAYESLQEKNL